MSTQDTAALAIDENVALFVDFLTSEADRLESVSTLLAWLADPVDPFVGRDYTASFVESEVQIRRESDESWPTLIVEVPTLLHGIRAIADILSPPSVGEDAPFTPTQSIVLDVLGDEGAFHVALALEPGFAWTRVRAGGSEAWLPTRNALPAIVALLDPQAPNSDGPAPVVPHAMFEAVRLVVANELSIEPVPVDSTPDAGWRVAIARSIWRPAGRDARLTMAVLCIHGATGLSWFVSDEPRPDPEVPGMPYEQAATRLLEILCFADPDQRASDLVTT